MPIALSVIGWLCGSPPLYPMSRMASPERYLSKNLSRSRRSKFLAASGPRCLLMVIPKSKLSSDESRMLLPPDQATTNIRPTLYGRPTALNKATLRKLGKAFLSLLLPWLIQLPGPALADAMKIWFAPMDWFVRPQVGFGGATDYMSLFELPASETIRNCSR